MKNFLIQSALKWGPKRAAHKKPQRILVVSTTALGDTLWATPAIESLKRSFPTSHLAVLTAKAGMQVLKHNPHIDKLHQLDEPLLLRFWSLRNALLKEQFDTVLFFHASQRLTLPLCASLGVSTIVGTTGMNKGLDALLSHPRPPLYQHEIARRLEMVEVIGGQIHSQSLSFFLQDQERLPKKSGLWVALHPGSKDAFKRWPEINFAKVGRMLKEQLNCNILITGSAEEKALMQKTAALIPGALLADTNLTLRSFAALLDQMDLLISNDTGPFHLAIALKKPAIGLFAATDPILCGPYHAPHAVAIGKKSSCTPCLKRKCASPFCLLQIGPSEVFDTARDLLR